MSVLCTFRWIRRVKVSLPSQLVSGTPEFNVWWIKRTCWHSLSARVEGHTCIHFRLLSTRSWCWQVADKIKWTFEASKWQRLSQVACNALGTEWQTMHTSSGVSHCRLTLFENQGAIYFVFFSCIVSFNIVPQSFFSNMTKSCSENVWSCHLLRSVHIRRALLMLKQKRGMGSVHCINCMWCPVTMGCMIYYKPWWYLSYYLYVSGIKPQQSRCIVNSSIH